MTAVQKLYSEEILMTETDEAIKSLYIQTMGSEPHHRMGKQRMIIEILGAQEIEAQKAKIAPVVAPVKTKLNTQEEILEALQPQISRGLKVSFDNSGWMLKNGVASDSGHMSVPLILIGEIANGLLRARLPAKIKISGEEMFG